MFKNFIIILFVIIFILSANADASCSKHPIYCQIVKNSKRINKKYAMKLSNVIYKTIKKYHIPSRIFTAILAQESSYRLGAKGCHSGLVLPKCDKLKGPDSIRAKCKMKPNEFIKEIRICSDFGIGQIYFKTAKGFNLDISLLTTDLEYSVDAAGQVLADFKKRYGAKEVDWWTRYNARSKTKRDIYKKFVERFL